MIPGARLVLLGKQGAGKGTQCARLSRHYGVAAHLDRRHASAPRSRRAPRSGSKAKRVHGPGELVPDEIVIGVVDERLDRGRPARPTASCSTASRARVPRPRRSTEITRRPPARPRRRPRRARATSCSSASPAGGCATTAARSTHVDRAADVRLDLRRLRRRGRPARRRHRGGDRPPPRALRARDRRRSSTSTTSAGSSSRSTASATADEVFDRLVDGDRRRATSGGPAVSRSPQDAATQIALHAPGRPGRGRDARGASGPRSARGSRPLELDRDRPRRARAARAPARTSSATTASRR